MRAESTVVRKLLFCVLPIVLGGCSTNTLTSATIEPEIKAATWYTSTTAMTDLTTSFVDYGAMTNGDSIDFTDAVELHALGTGWLVFGYNQLLDGDTIEDIIIRRDSLGDEVPNIGNGDWLGLVKVVDHFEGKLDLVEVWVNGVQEADCALIDGTCPANAVFSHLKVAYRSDGFFERHFDDSVNTDYLPAVTIAFGPLRNYSNTQRKLPKTALPASSEVAIHFLTDNTGVTGVSQLQMRQAKYSDGSGVLSPSGKKVAATVIFKTPA